jgi:hypothetical protein
MGKLRAEHMRFCFKRARRNSREKLRKLGRTSENGAAVGEVVELKFKNRQKSESRISQGSLDDGGMQGGQAETYTNKKSCKRMAT